MDPALAQALFISNIDSKSPVNSVNVEIVNSFSTVDCVKDLFSVHNGQIASDISDLRSCNIDLKTSVEGTCSRSVNSSQNNIEHSSQNDVLGYDLLSDIYSTEERCSDTEYISISNQYQQT